MFNDVSFMNSMFGNPKGYPDDPNWGKLLNQARNIQDEYLELLTAINEKDVTEVRDALCDIMVFTLGMYHFLGHDANGDMAKVYESNMSKFCSNPEELSGTVIHYNALGVQAYIGGEFPFKYVKSLKQQTGLDGKNYPQDKFLKNINWKEPIFD